MNLLSSILHSQDKLAKTKDKALGKKKKSISSNTKSKSKLGLGLNRMKSGASSKMSSLSKTHSVASMQSGTSRKSIKFDQTLSSIESGK